MWQREAEFCPLCGSRLGRAAVEGRERVRCPDCAFVLYENPKSAAAGLVLDAGRRVLLVRRAIEPCRGQWALPAGYQEVDESPAETAAREVLEEAGIEVEVQELFDLLFVPSSGRRAANLAVYLCRPIGGVLRSGGDTLEACWFDLDRLPAELGFENGPRILARLQTARRPGPGESSRPG